MKIDNKNEVQITAMEHNTSVYDDSAVTIPDNNYSSLTLTIPVVRNLALTERIAILADGTIESIIDVWWDKPPTPPTYVRTYLKANIYISEDNTNWRYAGESFGSHFEIPNDLIVGVTYYIKIVSVTDNDIEGTFSTAPSDSITITGKESVPNNVANFAYTFTDELVFIWDKNTDKDLAGYEIRTENDNWGVQNAYLIYRGLTNTYTIVKSASRAPGIHYIKAYDSSGNYSETAQSLEPTNAAPSAPTISFVQWFGFAKIEWTDAVDNDLKYYEVYKSHTNVWGGEEFSEIKTPGKAAIVQGNAPVDAIAASPDATSITDANLIGKGIDYFVGDRIVQTSGTYKAQEATVTAFDNDTGKVTVASWPSGTPDADDEFVIKDRAYYKVRGVDTYGGGDFSSAVTIDFTPLAEAEIGDEIISARKLIAGELITLSAQIKDLIVTNAKIYDLDGSKITAESITLTKLASEAVPPKTYYQAGEPSEVGERDGDYWIDTDASNTLYVYDTGAWHVAGAAGSGITTFRQSAIPTAVTAGDLWIDTDDNKLYRATNIGDDQITAGQWELQDAAVATGWAHGDDITHIDGGKIQTKTVVADAISVTQLDAIQVNTGSLNVDESITVGVAGKVIIDGANEIIKVYDASANLRVELGKLT